APREAARARWIELRELAERPRDRLGELCHRQRLREQPRERVGEARSIPGAARAFQAIAGGGHAARADRYPALAVGEREPRIAEALVRLRERLAQRRARHDHPERALHRLGAPGVER